MIEKKFWCRSVNRKCTNRAQVFHIVSATAATDHAFFRRMAIVNASRRPCRRALDARSRAHYPVSFMITEWRAFALVFILAAGRAGANDDATLFRVFLKDGATLVSYGEPARVDGRVIFSMPTAAVANPPLHLVDIAVERVDWERTERYAANARATHYLQTRAENDYAALSNNIAAALNDVTLTADPARRLAIVENARRVLAEWPQTHYGYRHADIRQMLGMLDEAIADLRAATGAGRFNLSLSTFTDPPALLDPLLPPRTPQQAIEDVLTAARVVESAAERTSLLSAALIGIERDKGVLPSKWLEDTRSATEAALREEARVDQSYQAITATLLSLASRRVNATDVRALERLIVEARRQDELLGRKRPEAIAALVGAIEAKLDAARRLQLARDRWAMRAPVLRQYYLAISRPIDLLAGLNPALENIKALAGSSPVALATIDRVVAQILKLASAIVPPDESAAAHALLVSAVQLAGNAARIRREATLAGDITRAWDASSAAAGALMLGTRARTDIQTLVRPPQLGTR
jgi:type II secretory pathway component PulJ